MAIRFESPNDINYLKRMIDSGQVPEDVIDTMGRTGGYVAAQPPQQQRQRMRVVGVGGGQVTDLGEEDARALPLDYTRAGIDIPGVGKGVYSRDGRYAVVQGPDGPTKVVLGYDAEGSRRANYQNLQMDKMRAELEQQQEQTGLLRDKRKILAAGPQRTRSDAGSFDGFGGLAGVPQIVLEKQYGKAPEGMRWKSTGELEQIPGAESAGMSKATEDEKRSAGLAIRMTNALRDMESKPEGARPQVIPEALRKIPLVGEALANKATPYERQTVEAAQLDALDAALTLATGAAYTKEQLAGLSKSYFPQLGDDDKTVADKKQRLADVIETAKIRAGRAGGAIGRVTGGRESAPAGAQAAPSVGTMKGGYIFTGGDPGSKSSWRKVQ